MVIKLNKFVSEAGVCARRKATDLIKNGKIRINNAIIKDPSYEVKLEDKVSFNNILIKKEKRVYILLNKPKSCISTVSDDCNRKTVLDCILKKPVKHLYPVGRLDYNTTGLLLLTNDGDFSQKMAHPKYKVKKVYQATLDMPITERSIEKLRKGVVLDRAVVSVDSIHTMPFSKKVVKIALHSGKYRVIHRLLKMCGYRVRALDRVRYASFSKQGLKPGSWRLLDEKDINKALKITSDSSC